MAKRTLRQVKAVFIVFVLVTVAGGLLGRSGRAPQVVWPMLILGFIGMMVTMGFHRCPHCGQYLSVKRHASGQYCKHCGEIAE